MSKKLFIISFLLFRMLFSQNFTGYSFLKIGIGGAEMALGEASVSKLNSVFSPFYNPALVNENKFTSFGLMHNEWIQDVKTEVLVSSFNVFGFPLWIQLNSTNIANIEIRKKPGEPEGTFDAHYFSLIGGTGFRIKERLLAGFAIKYLYENIFIDESNGYAIDFGLLYKDLIENVNLGFSIRNTGKVNSLSSESSDLPQEIRFGISSFNFFSIRKFVFNPTLELRSFIKSKETNFIIGMEVDYNGFLKLRTGYRSGNLLNNYSLGIGLVYGRLNFDFAYIPFKNNFNNATIISLQLNL